MSNLKTVLKCLLVSTCLVLWCAEAKPAFLSTLVGTPYLYTTFNYPVDPNRAAALSPSFQAANGPLGANLVAQFGTGHLRSYEAVHGRTP